MVIYVPERQRVNMTLYSSKVFLYRMKFQSHWNKVDFMIQILVKEMLNISLEGWKGMTHEFENSNCQTLKDGI